MASPMASPMAQDPPMAFRPRAGFLTVAELEPLMRVCPAPELFRAGFSLPDADVDDVLRAAKELEAANVYVDPAYPGCLDLSSRIIRLLQVALDVQFQENDELIAELNTSREEVQELEERERRAQAELDRLRSLRDREQGTGDAKSLQERCEDLARRLDDEYRSNDRMRQQRERDERRMEDLEYRLQRADDDLRARDDQLKECEDQLRRLQEEYTDLRQTHEALRAEHAAHDARQQIGDTMRQQEWKIERMIKENRALELQNVELRKQAQDVKSENLEVSEKIVSLDESVRQLKAREAELEGTVEQLTQDKAALIVAQEELRADVADKVGLLDSFEARFQRQFRSWEEERGTLQAQIEALRRGAGLPARGRSEAGVRAGAGGNGGTDDEQRTLIQEQLNAALEREVLLLEAYEQLELSVASEIDKALAKQAEDLQSAERRVAFLTQRIEEERKGAQALRDHQSVLEDQIRDATLRNQQYEGGVYGLPQAVEEIHQLKDAIYKEQGRVRDMVTQMNTLMRKVEDLSDENTVLRRKAGVSESDKVDTKDVRMQKDATIAQLRSLNALLERQVADLEEERCKLRMEMKFRAKYHGQHALEMGLTPEQLLLLEQIVDDIKNGRSHEARLVDQLTHRIRFLEVRLGEVMAYADIPPAMRPALSEYDPVTALTGAAVLAPQTTHAHTAAAATGPRGGVDVRGNQVQALKAALQKTLGLMRQINTSLAEKRNVSDSQYQQWTQQVIDQLTDMDRTLDALLRNPTQANTAAAEDLSGLLGGAAGAQQAAGRAPATVAGGVVGGDAGYLADAMADELRDKLRGLARQVADLQAQVITKEGVIQQLVDQKAEMERRYGKPVQDRKTDFVPRADYESLCLESASLKEQLVACLEELSAREREAHDLAALNARYQTRMQTYSDQVKVLYREYAVNLGTWKSEKHILDRKIKKLQEDADGHKAAASEYSKGLDTLSRGALSDVQRELADTVRRMAVVQIKHAKIARELEASTLHERVLSNRGEELEQEVQDVSSTCRARMRWLEHAAETARRRLEGLLRELQGAVPLTAHQMLADKHARQQAELRRCIEEAAQQVVSAEELFKLRDEVTHWMSKSDALADANTELRERVRQLELVQSPESTGRNLDIQLAQELVATRVALDSAGRRVTLIESERDRLQRTLQETQTLLKDVEDRLSQSASEVEMLRASRAALERRYQGCKTKAEAEQLQKELETQAAAAAEKHNDYASLCNRTEEAERKLEQAVRDRQRHLAEITNLRAALRDISSHRESASVVGKLHEQLDHALAKECLARNALNRSELHRFEAEKAMRKAQAEIASLTARLTTCQDQAKWSDKQRSEAQTQLDISLAGRTENWKAKLWSRKLQQLKARNDAAADMLERARRRIKKLEDQQADLQIKIETSGDLAALSGKGAGEVARDAARLHEQCMQLRMERGKLQREEVLLREKVHYVERVNAELHELIEKYESEFFQQQQLLEGDKACAVSQARELQDECVKLQERLGQLLAQHDTHALDPSRRSLVGGVKVGGDIAARLKAHLSAANASERDIMLKQIDALSAARQEAEHLRQERNALKDEVQALTNELSDVRRHHNDALARLKQQSEALLFALNNNKAQADDIAIEQMKAVAEATINELKERLKERQKALDALEGLMAAEQARWLAQHQTDRKEIERLNQCLFEKNDQDIDRMKDVLSRIPRSGPDSGDTGPLTRTGDATRGRDQQDAHSKELAAMRAQVEQLAAERELLEKAHSNEVKKLLADISKLESALEAARRTSGPTRAQVDRLQADLHAKDEKLRLLRDAFKTLEGKLIDAHKKLVDEAMEHSQALENKDKSMQEAEEKHKRLAKEHAALQAEVSRLRAELRALRGTGLVSDDGLSSLREQLQAAVDRALHMEQELSKTRSQLQKYKNAERSVLDLTTGMSVEAKRRVDELQKRLNVLEKQNAMLKRCVRPEDLPKDTDTLVGGGASSSRPGTATDTTGGGAAGGADMTATAVAQWEESKRLNKKIEDLKRKMAQKQEELLAARTESERRGGQVTALQKELDKQAGVIRDMQDTLSKAQAQPRTPVDMSKLKTYLDKLMAAEQQVDDLKLQLARAGVGVPTSGAGDAMGPEAELFELRIKRDQMQVQIARLKERLKDLFGVTDTDTTTGAAGSSRGGPKRGSSGGVGGRGGRGGGASEAELLATIATLKAALEKATASSVPTTKYMAEVNKRKELQQQLVSAAQESERLRAQLATLQRMVADAQASNSELQRRVRATGANSELAAEVAAADAQIAALKAIIAERDSEIVALRALVTQRDHDLAEASKASRVDPSEVSSLLQQVTTLQSQLIDLQSENSDLKAELNAFDPRFFDEIEDLKHEHYVLSGKVDEYERLIVQLSGRLGQPPPPGIGTGGSQQRR